MTIQTINLGNYANDGTGDDLRTAFTKVNNNFNYIANEGAVLGGTNLGNGTALLVDKNPTTAYLEFNTLGSTDNSITFTTSDHVINLQSHTKLQNDTSPTLGRPLNLNDHVIFGGDVETTVFGYDAKLTNNFESLVYYDNRLSFDLGTINRPTGYQSFARGYDIDLNGTGNIRGIINPPKNDFDFGLIAGQNTPIRSNGHLISLSGNFVTTGNSNITLNATGNTTVTLPRSGTLVNTAATLNQFASTTSSQLASVISDSTGTGNLVFNTNPLFNGTIIANNISAAGYLSVSGNLSVNNTLFEVDGSSGDTTVAGWLNVSGAIITNITPGNYSFDGQTCTANVAHNETVSFNDFSGSILVTDYTTGSVTLYLVGGAQVAAVGSSNGQVGSMAYSSGINGYVWTSTSASTNTFSFVATRTRAHA